MPILWRFMSLDQVKNKTNSLLRQFVIILQNQGPSQGVQHMHHFLAVCWVRNPVNIKTVKKYFNINISLLNDFCTKHSFS